MVRGLTAILHCDDLVIDVTIAVTHADEQDYWRANWDDYILAFMYMFQGAYMMRMLVFHILYLS